MCCAVEHLDTVKMKEQAGELLVNFSRWSRCGPSFINHQAQKCPFFKMADESGRVALMSHSVISGANQSPAVAARLSSFPNPAEKVLKKYLGKVPNGKP